MKLQAATQLLALASAARSVLADDDIPTLISDGPFALRVKGKCSNSSVDGYLHTVPVQFTEDQMVLQYDARRTAPRVDDPSYRFYFNYTGRMQSGARELGFFLSDRTAGGAPGSANLTGRALSQQYRPNTNVALSVLGVRGATVDLTGFDEGGRAFLNYYTDDSLTVPAQPANVSLDINYYNWAVCWQTYYATTGPFLSWITAGEPNNPTCERVDLLRADV